MNQRTGIGGLVSLLAVLAACTVPNPNFNRVTVTDSGVDNTPIGTGGEPGFPMGTGGSFPYETGGAGSDGTGGGGGSSGGGTPGGTPDAQGSDTNPGGTIDAGSDGATPMADANVPFDASLNDQRSDATMPPDVSSPVDGPAPMPDVAADMRPVMDTSSPPPDMASPPDVMPPPPDVSTAPDAVQSMVNGLRGEYHNGQNFETPVFTRIDQVINFSWVKTSPDPRIGEDNFSVRWTGYIEPRYTDTYTISTLTDDGARLWIDGVVYIDKWSTQSGIEHSAVVNLVANRRYAIRMEFFDRAFTGSAQLFWRSSQQAKEIIPYTRLWTP